MSRNKVLENIPYGFLTLGHVLWGRNCHFVPIFWRIVVWQTVLEDRDGVSLCRKGQIWLTPWEIKIVPFEKKSGMLIAHYKRFRIHKLMVSLLPYTYWVFRFHLDLCIFLWDLRGGNSAWENTDTLLTAIVVNSRLYFTSDPWVLLCLLPGSMKLWLATLIIWK